jgi:hypothetical protein
MLDFDDFKTLLRRRSRLTICDEQTYCEKSEIEVYRGLQVLFCPGGDYG